MLDAPCLLSEDEKTCSMLLLLWLNNEHKGKDMKTYDEEINKLFLTQVIRKKFEVFGIDIVLPDELLAIITICTNSNPGQGQILLKYILDDIKNRKGPIPKGYVVKSEDFVNAFESKFPILHQFKALNTKFQKLWDAQKKPSVLPFETDNKCDTPEWWLEVMEA